MPHRCVMAAIAADGDDAHYRRADLLVHLEENAAAHVTAVRIAGSASNCRDGYLPIVATHLPFSSFRVEKAVTECALLGHPFRHSPAPLR